MTKKGQAITPETVPEIKMPGVDRQKHFLDLVAVSGDIGKAAKALQISYSQAIKILSDQSNLKVLDAKLPGGLKTFSMGRQERVQFLQQCAITGLMPRAVVAFNEETQQYEEGLAFDSVTPHHRLRCVELLGRMEGDFILKHEIVDNTGKNGNVSPNIRHKLGEIYDTAGDVNAPLEEEEAGETTFVPDPEVDPLA